MKKAIISGGNGFIGKALAKRLLQEGYKIVLLIRNESVFDEANNQDCFIVYFDLHRIENIDIHKIEELGPYDCFFHFAWEGSTGDLRNNLSLQQMNAMDTVKLYQLCDKIRCKKFVCAGSISELDFLEFIKKQNSFNIPDRYAYAYGKFLAHMICEVKSEEMDTELIWPIITNVYGVGEENFRFINKTIHDILERKICSFTSGDQNYDFIYINDAIKAIQLLSEKGHAGRYYVIGSGNPKPLKEFIVIMYSAIMPKLKYDLGVIPYDGVCLSLDKFSTQYLEEDTDFRCEISFEKGCKLLARSIEENDYPI